MRIAFLSLVVLVSSLLLACQTTVPGYPQQAGFLPADEDFAASGIESHLGNASPEEVSHWFGDDFASLPALGVVLVLMTNSGHEDPVLMDRHLVSLNLSDGSQIKPLFTSDMTAWLREIAGLTAEDPFKKWPAASREEYEKGMTKIEKGQRKGDILVFRLPRGTSSGSFLVEYTLDLGSDGQKTVKQHIPLNLR